MSALKRIAMALALAAPGIAFAATDGTPGSTSTGTFNANVTISPQPATTVEVIGLNDFSFGSYFQGNIVPELTDFLCLKRSTPGQVSVTITSSVAGFNLVSGSQTIQLSVGFINPGSETLETVRAAGVTKILNRSEVSCDANTADPAIAHRLKLGTHSNPIGSLFQPTSFSNIFTVLVAPL